MKRVCSIEECDLAVFSRGWCSGHWTRWRKYGDPRAGSTGNGEPATWLLMALTCHTDECIVWPFNIVSAAYPLMRLRGVKVYAHALACEIAHGPRPTPEHQAAHDPTRCTTSLCINPRHLRWATPAENSADQKIGRLS